MTPTPLTPDQIIERLREVRPIYNTDVSRTSARYTLAAITEAGLVVVEATGPDTTPISDVVRDGADKSSRETADSCRSMENGTPLTCELPAGHHGPHSFDPSPEGLVPDPREPGTWLGRANDVANITDSTHEWEARRRIGEAWANPLSLNPSTFVQARPVPQATTSPRWTVDRSTGDWMFGNVVLRAVGGTPRERTQAWASLLDAGAAAPQPGDPT